MNRMENRMGIRVRLEEKDYRKVEEITRAAIN